MAVLKHLVAWPLSWFCYGVGHLYSLFLNAWDNELWAAFWYPLYNDFMIESSNIQDWAGGQAPRYPWSPVGTKLED